MKTPPRSARWFAYGVAILASAQAWWFCGCAGMNYYPSDEEVRQKKLMDELINSDPGVRRIMTEHRGWNSEHLREVDISSGSGAWSFFYGLYYADRKSSGDGAYVSPPVDVYGRAWDKAFTEAELDLIADKVAAASREVGLPHKVEFRNQADHDQVTRVIGPRGEWIRKR